MRKQFITADEVRNDGVTLAHRILKSFGIPDIIYVSLRGGAVLGNVISEYFQMLAGEKTVYYAAVVARSYRDVGRSEGNVIVEGWTYPPERLRKSDRILLVDDIFDTGRTVNLLVRLIMERGVPRGSVAVAVHDYKIREYEPLPLPVTPDYYCRRHEVKCPEDDFWIHYLSHELKSLTEEEIAAHYHGRDGDLEKALKALRPPGDRIS